MRPATLPKFRGIPCISLVLPRALNCSQAALMYHNNHVPGWDGSGSQQDLMVKDQCILVNEKDEVLGAASKYDAHRFNSQQPRGKLHRAFSVFLFNSKNKLLLQQRAAGKITFPSVWTNTCCSHQLHGQQQPEVDNPRSISLGAVEGAKRAAIRKLQHELGISPKQLPFHKFNYLTRLHYCAPDTLTYGPSPQWGEHEVDYILFARADVDLDPNPQEVQATKYVSNEELREMMAPGNGLLWSPWFRIISEKFLDVWWKELNGILESNAMQDFRTIHRIGC